MMDVRVTDRETVERGLLSRTPYALISITDSGLPPVSLPDQLRMKAIVRLSFADATPDDRPPVAGEQRHLMTHRDVETIWRFVVRYAPEVRTIVVHCEAGWSRSPAVAAAISYAIGDDATRFFRDFGPNLYVFRLMLAGLPRHLRQSERH